LVASKEVTLSIERREKTGTAASNGLRRRGKVPAVLYGHGTEPLHVAFSVRDFDDLLFHRGGRTGVITLKLDGAKPETALVREVMRNPVTRQILHVDLQRVSERESVHAEVPVAMVGAPMGVRQFGGVMDVLVHEIEIEGPVNELPDRLEIDVNELGIHQHRTAGEIPLPKGFKLLTPADTIVVSVEPSKTAQHLEEAEAAAGAVPEEAVAQVPVPQPAPEGEA
jgi:large subunit ribosomal protein L25